MTPGSSSTSDGPRWYVVAEPLGANPALKPKAAKGGKAAGRTRATGAAADKDKDNVGGVVVKLVQGGGGYATPQEVGRVGFIRATSENPKDSFDSKLDEIVAVAKKSADTMNKLAEKASGELL